MSWRMAGPSPCGATPWAESPGAHQNPVGRPGRRGTAAGERGGAKSVTGRRVVAGRWRLGEPGWHGLPAQRTGGGQEQAGGRPARGTGGPGCMRSRMLKGAGRPAALQQRRLPQPARIGIAALARRMEEGFTHLAGRSTYSLWASAGWGGRQSRSAASVQYRSSSPGGAGPSGPRRHAGSCGDN